MVWVILRPHLYPDYIITRVKWNILTRMYAHKYIPLITQVTFEDICNYGTFYFKEAGIAQ